MSPHIYVYWLQFLEFIRIMLPVIKILPRYARHLGSIMKWGEKKHWWGHHFKPKFYARMKIQAPLQP
jgi:hypothetical protein